MALIFFYSAEKSEASLPLTETIYSLLEDEIEFGLKQEVIQTEKFYRTDVVGLGFGILANLSAWMRFQYMHDGILKSKKGDVGDFQVKLKYYIGDYMGDSIHAGFLFFFRFPSGRNAYVSQEWRNLALGKNEFRLGPYFQFDLPWSVFLHLNSFFTFREGKSENFYGGFYINIFEKETWVKAFGFNPNKEGTFFNRKRLGNDYFTFSLAVNTDRLLPFVPFAEVYGSVRPGKCDSDTNALRIEAAGVNPVLLLSGGIRYFFSRFTYLGLYGVFNPFMQEKFLRGIYGIEFSMQY
jgi:hypothetical protein